MQTNQSLLGHQQLFTILQKRKGQKIGNHAYCFVGPRHVGKSTLVNHLAAYYLDTDITKVTAHPDFLHIKQEVNQKTNKTKKHIDIEQIRNAKSIISTKPFVGMHRVVHIESAELLNQNASNALLKTLEEPAPGNLIFLTTAQEEALMDTIRSRCQTYYLKQVPLDAIAAELQSSYARPKEDAMQKATRSRGLPGLAIRWSKDHESYQQFIDGLTQFHELAGKPFYQKIKETETLFGDKKDHIKDREMIQTTLNHWQIVMHEYITAHTKHKNTPHTGNFIPHDSWDTATLVAVYDKIEQAKISLKQNIHPRLLIETILLTIP